jgi:hypothetical protein
MMPCNLKPLPGATVLYDGGQLKLLIRSGDLLLLATVLFNLKDKFNTFILKNKLIAKSVEGILHNQKSSLEHRRLWF